MYIVTLILILNIIHCGKLSKEYNGDGVSDRIFLVIRDPIIILKVFGSCYFYIEIITPIETINESESKTSLTSTAGSCFNYCIDHN